MVTNSSILIGVEELTEILIEHFSGSGIAYLWEQQLLNTPRPS